MVSTYSEISYTDFEKFRKFAQVHGNDEAIKAHAARGLGEDLVEEAYRRFAKALVPVGAGSGNDVRFGMEYELTAQQSPFSGAPTVTYQLTRNRAPVAGQQVDVFFKSEAGVEAIKSEHRTDEDGLVVVPGPPRTNIGKRRCPRRAFCRTRR